MSKVYYGKLRKQYPKYISLDKLSVVCEISKRSAKYLVEHGIISAIDTGKETWRYKIALEDVITYLRNRQKSGSMIPVGAVSSRKKHKTQKMSTRKCFAQLVKPGQEADLTEYFSHLLADSNDVLTTSDIAELTGLEKSSVLKLLKAGHIKHIVKNPKYHVPKQYLLDFIVTPKFIEFRTDSEYFKKLIGGYEIWISAK